MLPNCPEDSAPRQKRRKVSISPSKLHAGDKEDKEDISMLPTENWHADQEVAAPMDGGDMFDFNYNIDGLTYLEPSFAF